MTSSIKSPKGIKSKTYVYENFQGLDTSRDITTMDTGTKQYMAKMNNAYSDWRGQIVRDAPTKFHQGSQPVIHLRFFGRAEVCWVERTGSGLNFKSDRGHSLDDIHPSAAIVTTTVFNQNVHLAAKARPMYRYNGVKFERNQSPALDAMRPAYVASVQRRLAVAGMIGKETQIHFSRVDNDEIFPDDEDKTSTSVLRAGYIDVANIIGTADQITGLGTFEQNRLVVFTADKSIIYRIDPDIERWTIDDSANINIGCASHNTICNAGTDLLFCSRSGVYSIKRSEDNGILVYSYSLSDKVDILFRELFASVDNPEQINAVFDQDTAQYHIFFPQPGGMLCTRLTLSMNPEGGQSQSKFSTGSFLNTRCGAFLNGQLFWGTASGVYLGLRIEDEGAENLTPNVDVMTPILWHGSFEETKETISLVIQAAGKGIILVDAQTETGRTIGSMSVEVDDNTEDNYFKDVPLAKQYERKWQHRYRGAQYRLRTQGGSGLLRIIGLAITVRT